MNKTRNKNQHIIREEFIVEKIVGKRIDKREAKYLVKWVGYPDSQNTWEPLQNLFNCQRLIETYENSLKDKKKYKKPTKNLLQNKRESGGNDKIFNTNNLFQESNSIYYEKGINLNKNSDIKNFFNNNDLKLKKEDLKNSIYKKLENHNNIIDETLKKEELIEEQENTLDKVKKKISNKKLNFNLDRKTPLKNFNEVCNEENFSSDNLKKNFNRQSQEEQMYQKIIPSIENGFIHFDHNETIKINEKQKALLDQIKLLYKKEENDNSFENEFKQVHLKTRKGELGKDKPKRIKCSKILNGELLCMIEWFQDKSEEKILPSEYSNNEIKKYDNFLLIRYYEERIKFKN